MIRIVKMIFESDKTEEFLELFRNNKHRISGFRGCESVTLLRGLQQDNIFFTYSNWRDEEALEAYRNSETFKEIWGKTKPMFKERAEAWSVEEL